MYVYIARIKNMYCVNATINYILIIQ